jgi:transcription antitermination factor NusG
MQKTEVSTVEIKRQIEDNSYKWYVLSVIAGQEELVMENLKERIKKQSLQDDVVDFMSPVVHEYAIKK